MTKSPFASCARMPANVVITLRRLSPGQVLRAASATSFSASAVVSTAVPSSTSMAEGPSSRFPCTVGLTSTPLPILVGVWNMVMENTRGLVWSSR